MDARENLCRYYSVIYPEGCSIFTQGKYLRHFGSKPSFQTKGFKIFTLNWAVLWLHSWLSLIWYHEGFGFYNIMLYIFYSVLNCTELLPVCLQPAVPFPSLTLMLLEPCCRQPNRSECHVTQLILLSNSDLLFVCSWTLHGDDDDFACPGSWSLLWAVHLYLMSFIRAT